MFGSWKADLVFALVLVIVWVRLFFAEDPPGMKPGSELSVTLGRVVVATLLTLVLGVLPALVAAALVGGTLA